MMLPFAYKYCKLSKVGMHLKNPKQTPKPVITMDDILKASLVYYEMGGQGCKKAVFVFLEIVEKCTDGSIGQFLKFLEERGHKPVSPSILKELGKRPEDQLGFKDFLVLMYIVKTMRGCCDLCEAFLKGLYFTCALCFDEGDSTRNLCLDCIGRKATCPRGHAFFVDNFALLHSKSKALQLHQNEKTGPRAPMKDNRPPTPQMIELHDLFQRLEQSYIYDKQQQHPGRKLFQDNNSGTINCSVL